MRGLQIAQKDIECQASKFESRISDAPKQEKEFMTISRQQEIKATLYIMLLQKREENAITLAATANNGRIVAVSYTHLDVYKRQSLYHSNHLRGSVAYYYS